MDSSINDKIKPLEVKVALYGPTAVEVRRVCANLNIDPKLFIKKACENELKRMGIEVK